MSNEYDGDAISDSEWAAAENQLIEEGDQNEGEKVYIVEGEIIASVLTVVTAKSKEEAIREAMGRPLGYLRPGAFADNDGVESWIIEELDGKPTNLEAHNE